MRRRPAQFLAVALAAPALALAQTPPAEPAAAPPAAAPAKPAEAPKPPLFTVYGTLNANFNYNKASGATTATQDVKGRGSVSFDSTNIGIRGTLKVDDYIGATYQCETAAAADGVGVSGLCNRNSRVGVTGNWGTLWYGNWDTPFKAANYGTKAEDPFGHTDFFGYQSLLGSPGFNYRSGAWSALGPSETGYPTKVTGFDVRAQNSIGYHSPRFYGVSVKLQYSVNELMNATATIDPSLYSAVLNWDYGPVSILAAYEQHNDGFALLNVNTATSLNFGATAANATSGGHASDSAWRVGAGYMLESPAGATTLSAMYDELTLKQEKATAGMVKQYKRGAWHVGLKHRIQNHEIRARYGQAADGSVTLVSGGGSTADYGASMLALGYAYHVAPSMQVYLHYAQITNKDNAQYTFTIGGSPAVSGSTPKGADPMAVGLGVRYAF